MFMGVGVGSCSAKAFGVGEGCFCWHSRASRSSSFVGSKWGIEVDEERFEFVWEVEWWEEEVSWGVRSPGGSISGVVTGVDISGCKDCVVRFQ